MTLTCHLKTGGFVDRIAILAAATLPEAILEARALSDGRALEYEIWDGPRRAFSHPLTASEHWC